MRDTAAAFRHDALMPEFEQFKKETFLVLDEVARLYRVQPKTIRNQIFKGTWRGPKPVLMRPMRFRKVDIMFDVQHRELEPRRRRPRTLNAELK